MLYAINKIVEFVWVFLFSRDRHTFTKSTNILCLWGTHNDLHCRTKAVAQSLFGKNIFINKSVFHELGIVLLSWRFRHLTKLILCTHCKSTNAIEVDNIYNYLPTAVSWYMRNYCSLYLKLSQNRPIWQSQGLGNFDRY